MSTTAERLTRPRPVKAPGAVLPLPPEVIHARAEEKLNVWKEVRRQEEVRRMRNRRLAWWVGLVLLCALAAWPAGLLLRLVVMK